MRWSATNFAFFLLAGVAVLSISGLTASADAHDPVDRTTSTSPAPRPAPVARTEFDDEPGPTTEWWPLESGQDARSIVIQARMAQGCPIGPSRAMVEETSAMIRIHVLQRYQQSGMCFGTAQVRKLTVMLEAPINGRRIEGSGLVWSARGPYLIKRMNSTVAPRVPRVLALAPDQAVHLLAVQGFRGEVTDYQGAQVVAQAPTRGMVPDDSQAGRSDFGGTVVLSTGP